MLIDVPFVIIDLDQRFDELETSIQEFRVLFVKYSACLRCDDGHEVS